MTINLASTLLILLAASALLHAALRCWRQPRTGAGGDSLDVYEEDTGSPNRRKRLASGIHRSPSRRQMFLLAAMLLAASMLAALILFSTEA